MRKLVLTGLAVISLAGITYAQIGLPAAQAEAPTMTISFQRIGWEPGARRVIDGVVMNFNGVEIRADVLESRGGSFTLRNATMTIPPDVQGRIEWRDR
jgi:hypothetical protein